MSRFRTVCGCIFNLEPEGAMPEDREIMTCEYHRRLKDEIERLRAVVDVVFQYIDRMNDIAECDPAEKILTEFVTAVMPPLQNLIDQAWETDDE